MAILFDSSYPIPLFGVLFPAVYFDLSVIIHRYHNIRHIAKSCS